MYVGRAGPALAGARGDHLHPWSFTLDHIVPLSKGGSLLDRANARSLHRACNSGRGNRPGAQALKTSRRW
ncbi:HNH endonuclease signature motif containing protein [Streptomyces sp. NPDC058595]|uniref:HNH endonuclease signature motif containing protein n=1 Tax=Streptomyces sp. NPDC058595 TaxID=3346550 RepID=UPI00365B5973